MYEVAKMKIKASQPVFSAVQNSTPVTYIGEGKANEIGDILKYQRIGKVLIITDSVLYELGLLDGMIKSIKDNFIDVVIFNEVKPDPTFGIVDAALALCLKNDCQGIIAFGGGSVLDTAKTVAASVTNGHSPRKLEGLLKVKKEMLPLIAVPTTAGTGSEVTLAAVISDDETHKKTTIVSPKIVPHIAVLDPALTVGLPPHITSSTAMDALTHALEAYVSTYATTETDRYALNAVTLICSNIEKAFNNPTDIKAREALLIGSFYGGMAFTRTYVGYVHAFSHNIGGKYGVPHGLGNAVILPYVMDSYKIVCRKRFGELSDLLKLNGKMDTVDEKSQAFVDYLFDLNKKLNIPERLEKFPREGVNDILEAGFEECHGTYPVPKYYTREEGLAILNKVCAK